MIVKRGYTGHEHIEEFGFIYMNGRVYDAETTRFLSADPLIQATHLSQSFNRYSYTMNNPLIYTDPSGYNWASDALGAICDAVDSITNKEMWEQAKRDAEKRYHKSVYDYFGVDIRPKLKPRQEQYITDAKFMLGQLDNMNLPELPAVAFKDRMAFAPLIGAAFSLGFEGYRQYKNGKLDVVSLMVAGATGAFGGVGKTMVGSLSAATSSNMVNNAYGQIRDGYENFDYNKFYQSGISGFVGGKIGRIGQQSGKLFQRRGVLNKTFRRGDYLKQKNKRALDNYYENTGTAVGSSIGGFIANQ